VYRYCVVKLEKFNVSGLKWVSKQDRNQCLLLKRNKEIITLKLKISVTDYENVCKVFHIYMLNEMFSGSSIKTDK
jgi:hypothetical protein